MSYSELLDDLVANGDLDRRWRSMFEAVPRRAFIPDVALVDRGSDLVAIDRRRDPEGWAAAVEADQIIITQMDDGAVPAGQPGVTATSSSSMPMMVALMLRACHIDDGMRMLEIGTGTGWNAALLALRLGDDHVVSIEIDPAVAEQARKALARVGVGPRVVLGDGERGWASGAPYDRILSTCTVHTIPMPWIEQTTPGGLIVTPWRSGFSRQGLLLQLTVASDEKRADGRFIDLASFMRSRRQRFPVEEVPRFGGVETATDLHPADTLSDEAEIAIGPAVPDAQWWREDLGDGTAEWRLDDLASGSWAVVGPISGSGAAYPVRQGGPRRLWSEVEAAYHWWERAGRPDFTRYGMTVTPDRQWTWLDHPDQPLPQHR